MQLERGLIFAVESEGVPVSVARGFDEGYLHWSRIEQPNETVDYKQNPALCASYERFGIPPARKVGRLVLSSLSTVLSIRAFEKGKSNERRFALRVGWLVSRGFGFVPSSHLINHCTSLSVSILMRARVSSIQLSIHRHRSGWVRVF